MKEEKNNLTFIFLPQWCTAVFKFMWFPDLVCSLFNLLVLWHFTMASRFPPDFSCIRSCRRRRWFWYVPNTKCETVSFLLILDSVEVWCLHVQILRFSFFFVVVFNSNAFPSSVQALLNLIWFLYSEGNGLAAIFHAFTVRQDRVFVWETPIASLTAISRYTKWRRLVVNESFPLTIRDNTAVCSLIIKSHYHTLHRVQTPSIRVQEQQCENLR